MTAHVSNHANFADLILGHYDAEPHRQPEARPATVKVGDSIRVNANQGSREGYVIAVSPDGSEAIVEYILPSLQTYRLRYQTDLLVSDREIYGEVSSKDGRSFGRRWPSWAQDVAGSDVRMDLRACRFDQVEDCLTRNERGTVLNIINRKLREFGGRVKVNDSGTRICLGTEAAMRAIMDGEISIR